MTAASPTVTLVVWDERTAHLKMANLSTFNQPRPSSNLRRAYIQEVLPVLRAAGVRSSDALRIANRLWAAGLDDNNQH